MLVWLIDTTGPGSHAGVTGSESLAMASAEKLMNDGKASSARIEFAYARLGGSWLQDGYRRSGNGWSASLAPDGSIRWAPFSSLDVRAS